jgi:ATP-dependent protease ClpP protease subunit
MADPVNKDEAQERPMFRVFAQGDRRVAEIQIYEAISDWWGYDASRLAEDLKEAGEIDEINVRIHSPGGDVFEGFAIFNILRGHDAKVTVNIDGIAASIAAVIAMAGEEISIAENGYMMIHNPFGFVMGEADELRRSADLLDKLTGTFARTVTARSEMDEDEVRDAMADETWYTAEEAVAAGLADNIVGAIEVAANADLSVFGHAPRDAVKRFGSQTEANRQDPRSAWTRTKDPEELEVQLKAAVTETAKVERQVEEETEMDEELKALLEAQGTLLASLTERLEAAEVTAEAAKTAAEKVAESAADTAANSRRTVIHSRLDGLVARGKVQPSLRDALLALLSSSENEEEVTEFLDQFESAATTASGVLTQEVARPSGERRHVEVSQRFTAPTAMTGSPTDNVIMPNPIAMAIHEEAMEGSESFEDYRRKVYELHGESPGSPVAAPWDN